MLFAILPQGYPHIPDFPGTGRWGAPNETCGSVPWSCQEGCSCSNGTSPCDVGQSCFWFASGCTIGCESWCAASARVNLPVPSSLIPSLAALNDLDSDGNGGRPGDGSMHGVGACRCPGHCINSTNNNPKYRTTNRKAVAGSKEDWTKFNPWRAPGVKPITYHTSTNLVHLSLDQLMS